QNPVNAYQLDFDVRQTNVKADFNFFPNDKHSIDFGVSSIHYQLQPGSFLPNSETSLVVPDAIETERALESAVYVSDVFNITPNITLNAGLRYSFFNSLGPRNVLTYASGQPKAEY